MQLDQSNFEQFQFLALALHVCVRIFFAPSNSGVDPELMLTGLLKGIFLPVLCVDSAGGDLPGPLGAPWHVLSCYSSLKKRQHGTFRIGGANRQVDSGKG